ncbi:MAG: ABC transporter substrate-binding protein [Fimbriimonadaceae bacterium]|nr:ABC transporter substrate-binding protein [Chitinophagales bacterium]
MRIKFVFIFCYLFLLLACGKQKKQEEISDIGKPVLIEYAKGFTITQYKNYTKLIVRDPLDTLKIIQEYHLYRDSLLMPEVSSEIVNIKIPVQDIICISTTHVGFLKALGLEKKIIACSGTKYIYDTGIKKLVLDGTIKEIGNEGALNNELIVSLKPDVIMAYNMGDPSYDQFDKLTALHLRPVLNNEYLETTPLGQAEWIKYVAVFFNELDYANKIFDSIAEEYNTIEEQVKGISNKPTVFTGMAFKGEWTIPGGKSFAANYLHDAGADYLWNYDTKTGNYPVALEEVIAKAKDADVWLHAGAAENLSDIKMSDERYTVFDAFKTGSVFNNNNRINENGGNDYWESGVISPQLVLKDLVKIFHPDLMTEHKFVYYKQLQ